MKVELAAPAAAVSSRLLVVVSVCLGGELLKLPLAAAAAAAIHTHIHRGCSFSGSHSVAALLKSDRALCGKWSD